VPPPDSVGIRHAMQFFSDMAGKASSAYSERQNRKQREQEDKWLREVMISCEVDEEENKGQEQWSKFKEFNSWQEVFEPVTDDDDSEQGIVGRAMQHAKGRAREALLAQIHHSVTNTVLKLALEIVSKLLTPIEATIGTTEHFTEAAAVLNALNGVLLTYRFGMSHMSSDESPQFVFLRKVATQQLARSIHMLLKDVAQSDTEAAAAKLAELKVIMNSELLLRAAQAALTGAAAAHARKKVTECAAGCVLSDGDVGRIEEAVDGALNEQVQDAREAGNLKRLDAGIIALQQFLKSFALEKIDMLTANFPMYIDTLVAIILQIHQTQVRMAASTAEGVQAEDADESLLLKVEEIYALARAHVENYVDGLVAMISILMGNA